MTRHTERPDQRNAAGRGMTWRDVWARQIRVHGTGVSRLTVGGRTKPAEPPGTAPPERDEHEDETH